MEEQEMEEEEKVYVINPEVLTPTEVTALEASQKPSSAKDLMGAQFLEIIQNPGALKQKFDLTTTQAENVSSLLTAGGAGMMHKLLARHLGPEIAGALGGFLGGYISRKVVGGR